MTTVEFNTEASVRTEGIEEAFRKLIEDGTMTPWKVVIDVPYARYVEFGTGPASNDSKPPKSNHTVRTASGTRQIKCSDSFWNLYEWCIRTHADLKDPYAYAYKLYKDTMEFGMPPRPFVRPVLHELEREFNKVLVDKGSFEGVAHELADRIARNLDSHIFPQSAQSSTGDMVASIRVMQAGLAEAETSDGIPPEVWASDTCDYEGVERTGRGEMK